MIVDLYPSVSVITFNLKGLCTSVKETKTKDVSTTKKYMCMLSLIEQRQI